MKNLELSPSDQEIFSSSARNVGIQVAILSLTMIVTGGVFAGLALWWKIQHGSAVVDVDWVETIAYAAVAGLAAVAIAGLAASYFARTATRPLAEALCRQRNFVADASHELRTPLSVMYARVQQLGMLTSGDERLAPVAAELKTDTQRMITLVEDLLQLATVSVSESEMTQLGPILAQVEAEGAAIAAKKDISFTVIPQDVAVVATHIALHRALSTLVDNAIKYAPTGGQVAVNTEVNSGKVTIRITDNGAGIIGVDFDRIFDRFARGTDGSHGIGLALVKDTITRCGGTVDVETTGPEGTTFRITLAKGN